MSSRQVERVAAQRQEVRQPAAHLLLLVRLLLEAQNRPLVLYLDNLETLQKGPKTGDPDAFATWRDAGCAALWRGLRDLVRSHPGRLAVLASTRYRHPDFGAVVPFHRLPDDALWRMLAWFPSLRRLSEESRAGLVARLAGHPRAVEFLDALIAEAILSWEYDNGPLRARLPEPGEGAGRDCRKGTAGARREAIRGSAVRCAVGSGAGRAGA